MKRLLTVLVTILGVVATLTVPAAGEEGSLPGGTSISVDVDDPVDGAFVEQGEDLVVSGTASVGEVVTTPDTTIVYVLDVSGSMNDSAGVDCDGTAGDDTRLTCQREAALQVHGAVFDSLQNAAVVTFNSSASVNPGGPSTGLLDPPTAQSVLDGVTSAGGGTNFFAAVNAAEALLAASTAATKLMVFISDGENTASGGSLPTLSGVRVAAFAIGTGTSCTTGTPALVAVAAAGTEGGTCEVVTDLEGLGDDLVDAVGSELASVEVSLGGTTVTASTTPSVPVDGPATVDYEATLSTTGLPLGPSEVCATASGSDAGGQGSVTECVPVEIVEDVVDCSIDTDCTVTTTDNDGNQAVATGGDGFTKVLALSSATEAVDCGGTLDCNWAFDVLFEDGTDAVVTLVVVATRENSPPPGQVEVFVDDVLVENKCRGRNVEYPCVDVRRVRGGRTQTTVQVLGDPRIRG